MSKKDPLKTKSSSAAKYAGRSAIDSKAKPVSKAITGGKYADNRSAVRKTKGALNELGAGPRAVATGAKAIKQKITKKK